MLKIIGPKYCILEHKYIAEIISNHFLGMDFQYVIEERQNVCITNSTTPQKNIIILDTFFKEIFGQKNNPCKDWYSKSAPNWKPTSAEIQELLSQKYVPVLFGEPISNSQDPYLKIEPKQIRLGIDIFGSIFFSLTRYEETINLTRDKHNRFPAYASHAYQNGYLHRPVVDEYVEILWWCMKRLWPRLERKPRKFRMLLSHDVDVPFAEAFSSPKRILRSLGGDMIKRKDPKRALSRLESWVATRREEFRKDSNYTFDRIMDLSEKHALKSAFYFKTACTNPLFDDGYSIDHPYLRQLLRDIHARGHEIGFHPSYETYTDPEQTKKEFRKLLRVCEEEGIEQANWGGRQHYLRWQAPITWRNWAEAGLAYDSTLSYADCAGFRCATCHEFPVFDLEQGKQLPLIERPLIAMEGSLFGKKYMGLNHAEAYDQMKMLKDQCRRYQGDFTLLWHNSSFASRKDWELYRQILSS